VQGLPDAPQARQLGKTQKEVATERGTTGRGPGGQGRAISTGNAEIGGPRPDAMGDGGAGRDGSCVIDGRNRRAMPVPNGTAEVDNESTGRDPGSIEVVAQGPRQAFGCATSRRQSQ
jgi:hypothetical protein